MALDLAPCARRALYLVCDRTALCRTHKSGMASSASCIVAPEWSARLYCFCIAIVQCFDIYLSRYSALVSIWRGARACACERVIATCTIANSLSCLRDLMCDWAMVHAIACGSAAKRSVEHTSKERTEISSASRRCILGRSRTG